MKKILWFDLETTGTDARKHGIIQFAALVEIDGTIIDTFDIKLQPQPGAEIAKEALEVNGISIDQLATFTPHDVAYRQIDAFLARHVSRYDRNDKFYPAGYNVQFDLNFLGAMFKRFSQFGIGTFINWKAIDPLPLLYLMDSMGHLSLPNYRLTVVCDHFGIPLNNAHNALADIQATRELMQRLKTSIIPLSKTTPPINQ